MTHLHESATREAKLRLRAGRARAPRAPARTHGERRAVPGVRQRRGPERGARPPRPPRPPPPRRPCPRHLPAPPRPAAVRGPLPHPARAAPRPQLPAPSERRSRCPRDAAWLSGFSPSADPRPRHAPPSGWRSLCPASIINGPARAAAAQAGDGTEPETGTTLPRRRPRNTSPGGPRPPSGRRALLPAAPSASPPPPAPGTGTAAAAPAPRGAQSPGRAAAAVRAAAGAAAA